MYLRECYKKEVRLSQTSDSYKFWIRPHLVKDEESIGLVSLPENEPTNILWLVVSDVYALYLRVSAILQDDGLATSSRKNHGGCPTKIFSYKIIH